MKTYSHKIEVIQKIKLLDFLNPLEELTEDSPKVQQFVKNCYRHRKKLKSAFGIHLTKDYPPIKLLNRLLERIGLKMGASRQERQGESRIRYYKLNQNDFYDTNRLAVIESLNQKFRNETPKCTQSQPQQAPQVAQKLDNCLYNNPTSVSVNKPVSEVIQDVASTSKSTAEINSEVLMGIADWGEVVLSQERINEAWALLGEFEQARLHQLFEEHQARNYQSENISQLENAIASQTPVKEVGFGSHFRTYQVLRILENGFAWVRRLWDKQECRISISQLAI